MGLVRNCMLTGNGNLVNLLEPSVEQIHLEDISLSLSKICRYSGGAIQFYSVAQHSLNCYKVAREMYDEKTQMYLLLHDAAEAYISDIPTPVKKLVPNIFEIEKNLNIAIYKKFNLELIPKISSIIPTGAVPYSTDLDFKQRDFNEVKEEFEDTVYYLTKKII